MDEIVVVESDPRRPAMFDDEAARFAGDRAACTEGKPAFIAECVPGARVQGR